MDFPRPRRAVPAARRARHRFCRARVHVQPRGRARAGRCRCRYGQFSDLTAVRPDGRRRPGHRRYRTRRRPRCSDKRDPRRTRHRGSVSTARVRQRSVGRPCPTRRRIHQHAVFYPGEQCREEHSRWHIGRHRGCLAGAPGTGRPRRAGSRARGRRVCAVESRTELRPVPASRGAAHRAACRHRDLCGIRGRFRVPAAKHARRREISGNSIALARSGSSCCTTSY